MEINQHKNEGLRDFLKRSSHLISSETPNISTPPLVSEIVVYDKDQRAKVFDLIQNLMKLICQGDYTNFDSFFEPKAVLNRLNEEIIGRKLIREFLTDKYTSSLIQYKLLRWLYDSDKKFVSCEFVKRIKQEDQPYYSEYFTAWFIKLSPSNDNTIKTWYTWRDPFYFRKIESLDQEWPVEGWYASKSVREYKESTIIDVVKAKFLSFENRELDKWQEFLHQDIIVRPPWQFRATKEDCIKGYESFHEKYHCISCSIQEFLYDYTHPNQAAYIQLFGSQPKDSEMKCEDIDYSFIEIVDGQIKYWRTYFYERSETRSFDRFIREISESTQRCRDTEQKKE